MKPTKETNNYFWLYYLKNARMTHKEIKNYNKVAKHQR
jgi:hypothetical protein